jgi:hypothetical protein
MALAVCAAMAVVAIAATPGAAAPARGGAARGGAARGGAARGIPDVTTLFTRAVKVVRGTRRPTFTKAVVLEADGMTRGGTCNPTGCSGGRGVTSPAGIVAWRFVLNNQASRNRTASATLFYGPPPKRFGRVTGYRAPFLDDVDIPAVPRMTLTQAVSVVRRAGYRKPFFNVTLRNPLGPKRLRPLYIFGFASGFVGVDTVTKKVSRLGAGVPKTGHIKG